MDLTPETTAPTELLGRVLDHHGRLVLTADQIVTLLNLQAEYRRGRRDIELDMALAAHTVAVTPEALTPEGLKARQVVYGQRGGSLAALEARGDEYIAKVMAVLTAQQTDTLMEIYVEERRDHLEKMTRVLINAVGPRFVLAEPDPDGDGFRLVGGRVLATL
ncbi:hypothetical protein [Frankia sp. ACN1ag]|uniref:hypothetical protein n=1 Tax=Frankia sp. ACN1ag TaxID=102891 RepID=UPI0006DD044C|nr:hypothetical protein [Frankia sp. ACN1ag]KQC37888.1 hypothetical protein UK82_12875 [Frankia sp. ACN1ag]